MLEARSAIAMVRPHAGTDISLADASGFTLTQYAWFAKSEEKAVKDALGALPARIGQTGATDHGLAMRTGPRQLWLVAEQRGAVAPSAGIVTPLSSSRTRISVSGAQARTLLARCAAVDFHASAFKSGNFIMTGIHHTPALILCLGEESFHVYAMRTFGAAVWEWLEDAARGMA
jgi:methylglutamate dehydrogenase subunit D